ncbi:MAG: hypothetical protein ACKVX7_17435 [Planctomycetota bacterium]
MRTKKLRNRLIVSSTLTAILALSGCSTVTLNHEDARALSSVKVAPVNAKTVTYYGRLPSEYDVDQNGGLSDAVVSLFKQTDLARKKSKRMEMLLEEAGVDVLGGVKEAFTHELASSTLFPEVVSAGDADAVFQLDASYGVQSETMTDDVYTPWLELKARLVKKDGSVLWKRTARVSGTDSGIKPLPFPDPFIDAALLRSHFDQAIAFAVAELADHMAAD